MIAFTYLCDMMTKKIANSQNKQKTQFPQNLIAAIYHNKQPENNSNKAPPKAARHIVKLQARRHFETEKKRAKFKNTTISRERHEETTIEFSVYLIILSRVLLLSDITLALVLNKSRMIKTQDIANGP